MAEHMLSTKDNPFDPFTQFEAWNTWDTQAGYHTLSVLGRLVRTSDSLSEAQQSFAIEQAIDEVIQADVLDVFIKVSRPAPVTP